MQLLTAAEMRAAEAAALASGAVSGLDLMERAGAAAVEAAAAHGLLAAPGEAAVLCGPGANGGDGFVVARLLAARGWRVAAFLLGAPPRPPADAAAALARWRDAGGAVAPFAPGAPGGPRAWDLVVDALFGTGLSRPLGPEVAAAWAGVVAGGPVLAIDAPSGLCLDTGRDRGVPAAADLTVTFHRPKRGHHLGAGPDLCGRLVVADIGLAPGPAAARLASPDPARLAKRGGAHKYDHGHLLVLAGGPGKGGAARLAARAALRVGAGLVTLGAPAAAIAENAARLDAVMLREIADAPALAAALADPRLGALLLGPGLGVGEATRALTLAALAARRRVVLDADALTSFAGAPAALFAALAGGDALLTPHGGEFARLFPDLAARLADPADGLGKIGAVAAAAARAGATVLLKGRDTVIAGPGGGAVVASAAYDRAAPWLATAGAGDVLAGLAAGLMARGLAAAGAAEAAAWLHVEAARAFGPGLIAEDLPEAIPAALRAALGG